MQEAKILLKTWLMEPSSLPMKLVFWNIKHSHASSEESTGPPNSLKEQYNAQDFLLLFALSAFPGQHSSVYTTSEYGLTALDGFRLWQLLKKLCEGPPLLEESVQEAVEVYEHEILLCTMHIDDFTGLKQATVGIPR